MASRSKTTTGLSVLFGVLGVLHFVKPEPFEFDWTLAWASTTPPPDTAIALQAVGFNASIENGNVKFWLLVATANAPIGHVALPMTPAKMDGRVASIWTSMKFGNPIYLPWIGGTYTFTT